MASGMEMVDRAGFLSPVSGSNRIYPRLNHTHKRKNSINMLFRHLE